MEGGGGGGGGGGKLAHSHSQPGGMDRTPPGTPKKGGKMLAIRVQMLDDTVTMFQVQAKALGRVLFDQVCNQLHLLESDYFGLEYQEVGGTKYWLDLEKPLSRQIGLSLVDTLVRFCVKFYTPDPSQLEEEFTRYLFCLQIKRDLSQGLLQCNSNTAALMASYIVQAECGDYVVEDYPDHRYLSSYKFVPNQDQELERRIMENHKKHSGQSPAEADLNLLETARRCEFYGIKMHPAKDHEGVPLNLAVAHMGIVVFQNFTKINTFSWAKIRKISFKRKRFLVKLHPEGYGYYKDTVEFFFEGRNECKNFWKKCVENHGFFRCSMVKKVPRQKTRVLSRGSSFRYSGRTQKQIVEFVRENYVKRQTFQRSQSFRHSSSAHSSVANVGTSISAHPLLPLGDNAVVGTPASLSCGSMTLTSSPLHTADIHAGGSPSPPLTTSVSPGTSATSSPQHFYPRETPYRRAGHRPTKAKHPHVRTRRAISPLRSPAGAATAADNRSANLSNDGLIDDDKDVKSSRISLKIPDFTNFNDVYSNCYSSLRSLERNVDDDNEINDNDTETDPRNLSGHVLNGTSICNESFRRSSSKISKLPPNLNDAEAVDRYSWHRSVSCKDLYHEENLVAADDENEKTLNEILGKGTAYDDENPYEPVFDSPLTPYDDSTRRKRYSVGTRENSTAERTADAIVETKIYSSSYPGTTSSLSTESAEGEPDDRRIVEIIDVKYDSQEEMALSHDDVSHDSYELLERESDDYEDDSSRSKTTRRTGAVTGAPSESDRTRSCSWGSERGIVGPSDSRSSENVVGHGYGRSRENGFWSLEREKSPKHKSEIDFRSLDRKSPKASRSSMGNADYWTVDRARGFTGRREIGRDIFDCGVGFSSEDKRRSQDMEGTTNRSSLSEGRVLGTKDFEETETYRVSERDPRGRKQSRESGFDKDDFGALLEWKRYHHDRRKNRDDLEIFLIDSEEELLSKGERFRIEERRTEKKKGKRDREEMFHEGIKEKEQKEWEREKERRQMERRKNIEEKQRRTEEEVGKRIASKPKDYANFQEIQFKKFDRVVSNQFGKYSEFLAQENNYELLVQERKVIENYEKVCQVGRIAKELERNERSVPVRDSQNLHSEISRIEVRRTTTATTNGEEERNAAVRTRSSQMARFEEYHGKAKSGVASSQFPTSPKTGKAVVGRTKSDPYDSSKNLRRNVLMHQKSIDLTPQQSEEAISDHDNEDGLKKTSRSEHDIPYILHKRHCMNGTARNAADLSFAESESMITSLKYVPKETKVTEPPLEPKTSDYELEEVKSLKRKSSVTKGTDSKKSSGLQIIDLDSKNEEKNFKTSFVKSTKVKKLVTSDNGSVSTKATVRKETRKTESPKPVRSAVSDKMKKESDRMMAANAIETNGKTVEKTEEPIYAEVYKGKVLESPPPPLPPPSKKIPPEPPKRTSSSVQQKPTVDVRKGCDEKPVKKIPPQPPKRTVSARKSPQGTATKTVEPKAVGAATVSKDGIDGKEDDGKPKRDAPDAGAVQVFFQAASALQRREESLILFARTRLGVSEGSAFAPIARQGRVGSPTSQRRTKSLDAPYVSLHRLPPVDAFSSMDDTVDDANGNAGDVVRSSAARAKEFSKMDSRKSGLDKNGVKTGGRSTSEATASETESETDSVFPEHVEMESDFKKTVQSQAKLGMSYPEEKVLDGVRSKRLLSKIESVDAADSEGDMDSSKLADPIPIPSDRIVDLPESVRFPSVRQISGQTSEESADGWDQKEVKVKRRTPRRSVGREDADAGAKESVVWDSKDDEPPDDEVWDDKLAFVAKSEGSRSVPGADATATATAVPPEYLKRGSCGQSIDDDNLSTPMKESSPEHWVSVDDLPEALEREEKLLRQQEKILREKILNEKLKRELNLDTIDVEERFYDYGQEVVTSKERLKGHSLDTYELTEKKLRERGTNKNSSLDEHMLGDKMIKAHVAVSSVDVTDSYDSSSYENVLKASDYRGSLDDYFRCKVVNDVTEIDQFGDNDEELEEFFVVLDRPGNEKNGRDEAWEEDETFRGTVSKEESLISVPEEFKDVEEEEMDSSKPKEERIADADPSSGKVEIRLSRASEGREETTGAESFQKSLDLVFATENEGGSIDDTGSGNKNSQEGKTAARAADAGRLSPYGGSSSSSSRRGSEETRRKSSCSEDAAGIASSLDRSSRRSSDDPKRLAACEDPGRLSPFNDSRRGSEDPRRLSASEDSRKYSISESVSEETRRRLSSTEETRRKRASLTKQCSVGADSLSDEMISGIQECSSSFEHDEKDVFEVDTVSRNENEPNDPGTEEKSEIPRTKKQLEIEVFEDDSTAADGAPTVPDREQKRDEAKGIVHLAPPTSERELSRETEDSVDYGEGDFKDIREIVKEKDMTTEGSIGCDGADEFVRSEVRISEWPSSFEKSESSEGDELRYIDEKRGSTPDMIVGKSRESVAASVFVVNEGISVLSMLMEKDRWLKETAKAHSLPREVVVTVAGGDERLNDRRHTLPKRIFQPKPKTPNNAAKATSANSETKNGSDFAYADIRGTESSNVLLKSSLDSSEESDVDRLSDLSLVSLVQKQIAKRNLLDTGKCLARDKFEEKESSVALGETKGRKASPDEEAVLGFEQRTSSEERERTESSSVEMKSSADEVGSGEEAFPKGAKRPERKSYAKSMGSEPEKVKKKDGSAGRIFKEQKSPDQDKRDSGEDGSSSSSAPPCPKRELSSTWKPFLLESSGSSSLEEGWLPPDDNAHLADEEETSSTSNNPQDDSYRDDVDNPTGIGYPVLNVSTAEMLVGGYGSVYALSRTLSRISERSASEQERSDVEDDVTKPSSHSASAEEESIASSDRQPSLSSDPPSPRDPHASGIPDLPEDGSFVAESFAVPRDKKTVCEPFGDVIPPPVPDDDWPSPPSSSSVFDTPAVSHVETFYMEIHPEEARKVVVAEHRDEGDDSSSDENRTLHEEGEFLHLSSDNVSASTTTTTTQDGTVIVPVRPKTVRTGSASEDASIVSTSAADWSSVSVASKSRTSSGNFGDEPDLGGGGATGSSREGQKQKLPIKTKPPKLKSPTGIGFFETPVSKVRSPTSQSRFFETGADKGFGLRAEPRSPTSYSEASSPKRRGRFFESSCDRIPRAADSSWELRGPRSPTEGIREPKTVRRGTRTSYYCSSNVVDSAEKSYFGRYDTGSLERTKIHSSRKCRSYYSVSKSAPNEEDGSNGEEEPPTPSSNTIPRASKKTKRRHRVAMDLEIRDGKIVAPPKTRTTVLENSDSDRSSSRDSRPKDSRRKRSDV